MPPRSRTRRPGSSRPSASIPHEAKDFEPARDGARFEELARRPGVVAIGEIGLDFHYDHSPRDRSRSRSSSGCSTARARLGLPVLLHNRESGAEMLAAARAPRRARERRSLPLLHRGRGVRREGDRPRLRRVLLRDDHVPRRREHPRRRGGPAARGDARRDRHALSRAGAPPRQALRAGVRRRDGEEAGRGQGRAPRGRGRRDDRQLRPSLRPNVES